MYAHAFVLIIRLHWPLRWHHSLWIVNTEQIKIPSKNLPRKLVLREREASAFQHRCHFPSSRPSASNRTLATPSNSAFYCDPISSSVVQGRKQVKYTWDKHLSCFYVSAYWCVFLNIYDGSQNMIPRPTLPFLGVNLIRDRCNNNNNYVINQNPATDTHWLFLQRCGLK